jgi:hypothetical protein
MAKKNSKHPIRLKKQLLHLPSNPQNCEIANMMENKYYSSAVFLDVAESFDLV